MPEDQPGLQVLARHDPALHAGAALCGPVPTAPLAGHRFDPSGLQRQRLARSIWQANLAAMDAPLWFGMGTPDQEDRMSTEEAIEPDLRELPQRFGILTGKRDTVSGISTPGHSAYSAISHAAGQQASVLAFPAACADASCTLSRRSPGVLPFSAPAERKAIGIFSLVGGVGGTSLAASLARVLANCGERILLADAGGHTLLPRYFGGKGSRQGSVRRFAPRPGSTNAIIRTVSLDVQACTGDAEELDRMLTEFNFEAGRGDRVVWDLGNSPVEWVARILQLGARVIIPLLPTAKCLMQVPATEQMLQQIQRRGGPIRWNYLLNQFDDRDAAHLEIRSRFRAQLGDRLLPFILRASPLVDEALFCGRTVVDHAPASPLVQDLWKFARFIAGLPRPLPAVPHVLTQEAWNES